MTRTAVHRRVLRDPRLPSKLGEGALDALQDSKALELIGRELVTEKSPTIQGTRWAYARWKPGVAATHVHEVEFADGTRSLVTFKRYLGDKGRAIAERFRPDARVDRADLRLRPFGTTDDWLMWTFPADRSLPGAVRVTDCARMARLLEGAELFAPMGLRRSTSRAELLRYKPERRAVFRFRGALRSGTGEAVSFAVRALPPEEARQVAAVRRAIQGDDWQSGPRLIATEDRTGILVEPWLEGTPCARDEFSKAAVVGPILARLHQLRTTLSFEDARFADTGGVNVDWNSLFAGDPACKAFGDLVSSTEQPAARCWVHGDVHPDQVLLTDEGPRLLDWDSVRPGIPEQDLATWIADAVILGGRDLSHAGDELLSAYCAEGAAAPDEGVLAHCVVRELTRQAAGGLRRYEQGAIERARVLLQLAHHVLQRGRVT